MPPRASLGARSSVTTYSRSRWPGGGWLGRFLSPRPPQQKEMRAAVARSACCLAVDLEIDRRRS
jgi:hypothetical protein